MAYTGAQILTEVRSRNQSYDSTTYGATDLQQAQDWVCLGVNMNPDQAEDFLMVADQKAYAYDVDTTRIMQAVWIESAGDTGRVLQAVSEDQLYQDFPTWQTDPSENPTVYCTRAGQLLLYPAPSASSVGGYPKVTLYSQVTSTLASGTTLPGFVRSIEPWVNYILYLDAARFNPASAEGYLTIATGFRQQLSGQQQKVTYRRKPRVRQRVPLGLWV